MPSGPPIQLLVDGELPKVEIIDRARPSATAGRKPNPLFLPALAAADRGQDLSLPAHYLKQFHEKYADPATLEQADQGDQVARLGPALPAQGPARRVRQSGHADPAALDADDAADPPQRFVAVRNPYFHRVDAKGQQLPYLDQFILQVVDSKLIPIKTGAGETDLQARDLFFKDYTFLKESEARSGLRTLLWPRGARRPSGALPQPQRAPTRSGRSCSATCASARPCRWRSIGRRSTSTSISAWPTPSNNTIIPESPLYTRRVRQALLGYDPEAANRLLDEIGLDGAMATARGCCRTGARSSSSSRPRARTASRPTCWS